MTKLSIKIIFLRRGGNEKWPKAFKQTASWPFSFSTSVDLFCQFLIQSKDAFLGRTLYTYLISVNSVILPIIKIYNKGRL